MRTYKKVLNGKGLLAASIAMLSGNALAETAGRVSFVSGDAAVTAKDGSQRALQRGDAINGGDRITTRAGRVQIRFTDGGFVSLQPNTVFGVDEYLYANRKPEETSLFFNLIQGGMRTITGAIGKVNKKSYAVRTPVATIGIRGTEYQAVVTPEGLKVSVGSGFVNVANQGGEVTGAARQVIRVTKPDGAPELTDEEIKLLSTRADGRERRLPQREDAEGEDRTITISDVQNDRGDYLFLFTTVPSLADSVYPDGPVYRVLSPFANNSPYGGTLYANFDQNGALTGSKGGVLQLFDPYTSSGVLVPNRVFDSGTLKVVNSGTINALSWGEFTHGQPLDNTVFYGPTNPLSLSNTQYLPYVIGAPSTQLAGKGFATYSLQGGTPARDQSSGAVGRLDAFKIRVNFDLAAMDAMLKVTMPSNTYTAYTTNSVSFSSGSPAFAMAGITASGSSFSFLTSNLTVSDANGNCAAGSASSSCTAEIAGFFAGLGGRQIGASYSIGDTVANANISGTAALGLASVNLNAPYLPDSTAGTYYELRYGLPGLGTWPGGTQDVRFDKTGAVTGTIGGINSIYGWLPSASGTGSSYGKTFDSGSLSVVNSGTIGTLSWGEFTNGSASTNKVFDDCGDGCYLTISLDSQGFLPYIVGANSYGALDLHKGTATYTLQAKTPARDMLGRTGTLNAFAIKLDLDFNTIQAGFKVSMPAASIPADVAGGVVNLAANTYTVATKTPLAVLDLPYLTSFALDSGQLSVTDTQGNCGTASASVCSASISAFFTGDDHEQIGAAWSLTDASNLLTSDIYGVAALGLTSTGGSASLASGPAYSVAFATPTYTGVNGGFAGDGLNVTIDANSSMTTATGFDPVSGTQATVMDRLTAQATNTGGTGSLNWGRWYGNSTDVNGTSVVAGQNLVTLSPTQSVSYIIGPMSQSSAFSDILYQFGEGATATYTYQGGTAAVGSDGVMGAVKAGSKLQMTFSWSVPTLAMDIGIDMQTGNDYNITGNAQLGLDSTVSKFSAYSGSGASCAVAGGSTGCTASVNGFFAGQQAQQIGLGYYVNDSTRSVSGAAAFGRGAITAASAPLP